MGLCSPVYPWLEKLKDPHVKEDQDMAFTKVISVAKTLLSPGLTCIKNIIGRSDLKAGVSCITG